MRRLNLIRISLLLVLSVIFLPCFDSGVSAASSLLESGQELHLPESLERLSEDKITKDTTGDKTEENYLKENKENKESEDEDKIDVLIGLDYEGVSALTKKDIKSQVESYAEVFKEFDLIDVISARMSENAMENLERLPGIAYVEKDGKVRALGKMENDTSFNVASNVASNVESNDISSETFFDSEVRVPWGVERIYEDEYVFDLWEKSRGEIEVAVLDTGIDESHRDLEVAGGANFVDNACWREDNHGHGTWMAGTIASKDNDSGIVGVAPEVDLYSVKVLGDNAGGDTSKIIEGIEWAVDNDIPIINMSLGGKETHESLKDAVNKAFSKGHILVAASGNESSHGEVQYPAAYENVIAVSASDVDDNIADFSDTGEEIDLTAPGVGILTTTPEYNYFYQDYYGEVSGTSSSAAHVSGAAAVVWGMREDLSNEEIKEFLFESAKDLGHDSAYQGHGLVNVDGGVELALEDEEEIVTFELQLEASPQGTGKVKVEDYPNSTDKEMEFEEGEKVEIKASAGEDYEFSRWVVESIDEDKDVKELLGEPDNSETYIKMKNDFLVTAVFEEEGFNPWNEGEKEAIDDLEKEWEISFNKELHRDTITEENIYITDKFNRAIETTHEVNEKEVVIKPRNSYDRNKLYTLWIKDLQAGDGSNLKENIKFEFYLR